MTGRDIDTKVRRLLDDVAEVQIWNEAEMIEWSNDGVHHIVQRRPDAMLDTDGTLITITDIDELSDTISIADKWETPLAHYVAALCLKMKSGQKEQQARSADHMQLLAQHLGA
jgi:hypothetical protein